MAALVALGCSWPSCYDSRAKGAKRFCYKHGVFAKAGAHACLGCYRPTSAEVFCGECKSTRKVPTPVGHTELLEWWLRWTTCSNCKAKLIVRIGIDEDGKPIGLTMQHQAIL